MRHFTVYLKPFKLDDVIDAIAPFGPSALVWEEVRGYGRQKGHLELYSGTEYKITFLPKVKVGFCAPASHESKIIAAVTEAARTGRIGDGKILVLEVRSFQAL
jgi:nitrogen regulatory protein PII